MSGLKFSSGYFNTHIANQFIESVSESANNIYYIFAARSLNFDDDGNVPDVNTSIKESVYSIYDEIIFGKRVTPSDIIPMIRRVDWQSGNTYTSYSHLNESLSTSNFYAVSQEGESYYVFKCLDNKGGVAANDQPLFSETTAEDNFYQTNDGYVWKYMYTIDSATWRKFATDSYIPLIVDANVSANAISGSIDAILIDSAGLGYNAYANGLISEAAVSGNSLLFSIASTTYTLSANTDFYKGSAVYIRSGTGSGQIRTIDQYIVTGSVRQLVVDSAFTTLPDTTSVFEIGPRLDIQGDGNDAKAIATINSSANSINTIEIINRGTNYTYADIVLSSNGTSITPANLIPIISPPGGHGHDIKNELFANRVGISVSFANNESNTIPTANEYRKIGLLKDPSFANLQLTLTTSTASLFSNNETIITYSPQQSNTLLQTYRYTLGLYQTLEIDSNTGFFETGDAVSFESKSGTVLGSNSSHLEIRLNDANNAFTSSDYIGDGTITKTISSVTSANPTVVVTSNTHGIANGTAITFHSLNGTALDDTANTTYYARNINTTAFSVYTDSGLTTSFDNSSNTSASSGYVTTGDSVANVTSVSYTFSGSNVSISGTDDNGNRFGMVPNTDVNVPVELNTYYNNLETDNTFDTTSFMLSNTTISNTGIVEARLYTNVETILTSDYISASNATVVSKNGKILNLTNVNGDFTTGQQIKGLTSNTIATIETIDKSFTTFNQLTKLTCQVISTGSSVGGLANTGFAEDQYVTQVSGNNIASGHIFSISNTITRKVESINTSNPALCITTINHGFSNNQTISFSGLNGTALNTSNSYFVETVNSTAFYIYTNSGLSIGFDNSANSVANSGTVTSSGIGGIGTNSFRTFYINNVKGTFNASGANNTFISNTSFGGSGAIAKITEKESPDLIDNSGQVLYIENMAPLARANDQTETLKIIFEF